MNKKLIERIDELFEDQLQSKTGWGKNEILQVYRQCVLKASLELIDYTGRSSTPEHIG